MIIEGAHVVTVSGAEFAGGHVVVEGVEGVEGVEERYDVEAVSSPSGVTHLTFTRR